MWEREEFQPNKANQDQHSLQHDEDKPRVLQQTNICREDERAGKVICTASPQENEATIHAG